LLDQYGLKNKIIAYVKDEGSNFNIVIVVLKFVIKCEILNLNEILQGSCSSHAFTKACQYATTNAKVYKNLKLI
jgi:hypothetical protein